MRIEDLDIENLFEQVKTKTFNGYRRNAFRAAYLESEFDLSKEMAIQLIEIWEELELIKLDWDNGFKYFKVVD